MQFTPNSIDACKLWLDGADIATLFQDTARTSVVTANGQNVKGWTDKSVVLNTGVSNNNHATETTNFPTYGATAFPGNLPAVSFAGGAKLLTTPSMLAGYGSAISIYIISAGGDTSNRVLFSDASANFWFERNGSTTIAKWQTAGLTPNSPSSYAGITTAARCDSISYNGQKVRLTQMTGAWRRDLLGLTLNKRRGDTTGTVTMSGAATIGNLVGGGFGWLGQIGEIVMYNRFIDQSEDRDLLEYFAAKWGLGGAGVKYCVCDGDSLTDGFGVSAGQSWPELMQVNLGSTAIVERNSYGGRLLSFASGEMYEALIWRSFKRASAGRQICTVFLGSNDLQTQSVAAFEANYIEYCQRLIQAGYFPIVFTLLPRVTGGAPFETSRIAFNTWLRTNYATFAYGLVDLGANAILGAPGAYTNTTYYQGDQIHPNATGHILVESLVRPVVSSVAALNATSLSAARGRMIGGI